MELSVDDEWVVFQICYDLNEFFKNLLLEVWKVQLNITPTDEFRKRFIFTFVSSEGVCSIDIFLNWITILKCPKYKPHLFFGLLFSIHLYCIIIFFIDIRTNWTISIWIFVSNINYILCVVSIILLIVPITKIFVWIYKAISDVDQNMPHIIYVNLFTRLLQEFYV